MSSRKINLMNKIFSDAYASKANSDNNLIMKVMYRVAYPFSKVLNKFGISPNVITACSLLSSLFAALSILLHFSYVVFFSFWLISILLDFCDGSVARMSGKISRSALDMDHMSDLLKLSLVILSSAYSLESQSIWVLSFISIFGLLFSDLLNHQLEYAQNSMQYEKKQIDPKYSSDFTSQSELKNSQKHRTRMILRNGYTMISTINGHTLFVFLFIPIGVTYAAFGLSYLIGLELWASRNYIKVLLSLEMSYKADREGEPASVEGKSAQE
jgi:phosphatidylglycerophosphate synthase